MTKRTIARISFLADEQRRYLEVSRRGKFSFSYTELSGGRSRVVKEDCYPRKVVRHDLIKDRDPVLTLSNGEKIRIYQGGDSTYMLVEVESILDLHERVFKEKSPQSKTFNKGHRDEADIFKDLGGW